MAPEQCDHVNADKLSAGLEIMGSIMVLDTEIFYICIFVFSKTTLSFLSLLTNPFTICTYVPLLAKYLPFCFITTDL